MDAAAAGPAPATSIRASRATRRRACDGINDRLLAATRARPAGGRGPGSWPWDHVLHEHQRIAHLERAHRDVRLGVLHADLPAPVPGVGLEHLTQGRQVRRSRALRVEELALVAV